MKNINAFKQLPNIRSFSNLSLCIYIILHYKHSKYNINTVEFSKGINSYRDTGLIG